jgi:hypothetical protein
MWVRAVYIRVNLPSSVHVAWSHHVTSDLSGYE